MSTHHRGLEGRCVLERNDRDAGWVAAFPAFAPQSPSTSLDLLLTLSAKSSVAVIWPGAKHEKGVPEGDYRLSCQFTDAEEAEREMAEFKAKIVALKEKVLALEELGTPGEAVVLRNHVEALRSRALDAPNGAPTATPTPRPTPTPNPHLVWLPAAAVSEAFTVVTCS